MAQNSLELKLPSGSSPPFYAKQRTLSPTEKVDIKVDYDQLPTGPRLCPISRIPCPSRLRDTIARTWKQPRCPSADVWIRKLWYIYTMEYYSAIKKKAFESVLMRWMKLEPIIQSEVSQKEKHQYSILTYIYEI